MSAAFKSKGARTYKARVYDRHGVGHRRTLGTTDASDAKAATDFLRWLRKKRRWPVLDLIIARRLSPVDAMDAHEDGTLEVLTARLTAELAASLAESDALARDTDLSPLVTVWALAGANAKYIKQVRRMIPEGVRFPRSQFTRKHVSEFLASLTVKGSTKNRYKAALSQFARWLVERDVLETNPVRDVRGQRERKRTKWMTWANAERVCDAAETPAYRALFAILYGSGADLGQVLAVTRADVDTDAHTIRLHGGKTHYRTREVRVEPWAWSRVTPYLRSVLAGPLWSEITESRAYRAHQRAQAAVGLSGYTLKDARHTFAVASLKDGRDPQWVRGQLGHAPSSTLLWSTYGTYIPKPHETTVRKGRKHG